MKYKNIYKGIFVARPNRFIAHVEIDGVVEVCHVKNTGRCKELLIPGVLVFLEKSDNLNRKTLYDLVGVVKNGMMINMDSQAPNKVALEWIQSGGIVNAEDITFIKPETKYGNSRFDIYFETKNTKSFVEVKGVTLEHDGVAAFPDAPTIRGLKHIYELTKCIEDGYQAYILFVIQMSGMKYFIPNDVTQPEFRQALIEAKSAGVHILARECQVTEDELWIRDEVLVKL